MGIQHKVEESLEKLFGWWADLLVKHTKKILVINLLLCLIFSAGMSMQKEYDEQENVWSPKDNPTEIAGNRKKSLFPSSTRFLSLILVAKNDQNLMQVDAFKEINALQDTVFQYKKNDLSIANLCMGVCKPSLGPLAFFTTPSTLDGITTNSALKTRIQAGKQPNGQVIPVSSIMKETNVSPNQNMGTGALSSSFDTFKATQITIVLNDKYTKAQNKELELALEKDIMAGNSNRNYFNVNIFTISSQSEAFSSDIQSDLQLVSMAVVLVSIYCLFFLGSLSPIHSRVSLALGGLLVVGLSFSQSSGLMAFCQLPKSGVHNLLPFLLIGIGVDDMFVIVNSVDQTSNSKSSMERFKEGFKHSGPSITITSFTNIMAFFLGATTSLLALKSFCIYAAFGILFLYLNSISLFCTFFIIDLERQHQQKKDCYGAYACSEQFCCSGNCLTDKQKSYPFQGTEADNKYDEKKAAFTSYVQKFLYQTYSYFLMKNFTRLLVLVAWLAYICVSSYGISILKVDFTDEYFISSKSQVYQYNMLNKKYFQQGLQITMIIENGSTDLSSQSYQKSMTDIFDKFDKCDGCSRNWIQKGVQSWYSLMKVKAEAKNADATSQCYQSWDSSNKVIYSAKFYDCLSDLLTNDQSMARYKSMLSLKDPSKSVSSTNPIVASSQTFTIISIQSSSVEGTAFLKDLRRLEDQGPQKTYCFNRQMYNYESYVVFGKETLISIGGSLAIIFAVLLVTTGNLLMTLYILLCVFLVILFLFSLLPFWDLTLNSITIVNVVIALGLSVDYSAHIGHSFQTAKAPKTMSISQQKIYRVRIALCSMGSSVFHGAISTFLAIIILAFSKSYIFEVFFKMWFGIIIFGVANGFILLPVLLSFIGPAQLEYEEVSQECELKQFEEKYAE